jgi:hypothetical protein
MFRTHILPIIADSGTAAAVEAATLSSVLAVSPAARTQEIGALVPFARHLGGWIGFDGAGRGAGIVLHGNTPAFSITRASVIDRAPSLISARTRSLRWA